jgi:hypothetical protein
MHDFSLEAPESFAQFLGCFWIADSYDTGLKPTRLFGQQFYLRSAGNSDDLEFFGETFDHA